MIVSFVFTVAMVVARVSGHGYLLVPPARNSAWRTDPENWEPNYNDNQQFCGGFQNQWEVHDGKCGICGDPYQGPYDHEAGGKYAKPHRKVTRCYNKADDVIEIHIVITAHHKGNNWGCDDTGCGSGIGPAEQFINCADIAILENCANDMTTSGPKEPEGSTSSASTESTSTESTSSESTTSATAAPPSDSTFACKGVGDWTDPFTMEWMCTNICYHNYEKCPQDMCSCNREP